MSQSVKQIKSRLRSIEGAQKVMKAMEMMAAAKLSRSNKAFYLQKPYFLRLESLMNNLIASAPGLSGPFFDKREHVRKIGLYVISSDSGLCGGYNNSVIRLSDNFINKYGRSRVKLVLIGKKGYSFFKKRDIEIINSYIGFNGKYSEKACDEAMRLMIDRFLSADVDEVYVAYTQFKTALVVVPAIKKLLSLESASGVKSEYLAEPDIKSIFEQLIPRYLTARFRLLLIESFASEHASRVVAMKTATENADELMDALTLMRNKVRQANITQEITEIVNSVEALKG